MLRVLLTSALILVSFSLCHSQWTQKGNDIDGEASNDRFGDAVDINYNGTIAAIGADYNNSHAGHVQVFQWNGSTWTQMGQDIDGEYPLDWSGWAIDLDSAGTTIIIGAVRNGDGGGEAGHARVFEWDGTNWLQKGNDIDGESASDRSGKSVCINSDGTIIAIGAYLNDGNGPNSGHVRVYEWNGSDWIQMERTLMERMQVTISVGQQS